MGTLEQEADEMVRTAHVEGKAPPQYSWAPRMRALKRGQGFEFGVEHYDTLNGIRQRLKRQGETQRYSLAGGVCKRVK